MTILIALLFIIGMILTIIFFIVDNDKKVAQFKRRIENDKKFLFRKIGSYHVNFSRRKVCVYFYDSYFILINSEDLKSTKKLFINKKDPNEFYGEVERIQMSSLKVKGNNIVILGHEYANPFDRDSKSQLEFNHLEDELRDIINKY